MLRQPPSKTVTAGAVTIALAAGAAASVRAELAAAA